MVKKDKGSSRKEIDEENLWGNGSKTIRGRLVQSNKWQHGLLGNIWNFAKSSYCRRSSKIYKKNRTVATETYTWLHKNAIFRSKLRIRAEVYLYLS